MKAKKLILEAGDERLTKLRERRGEVPGGFIATRDDGRVWEWKLDAKANAYRLSVAQPNPATGELSWARDISVVSFYSIAQAERAIRHARIAYETANVSVESYRDEPWELRNDLNQ